MLAMDFHEHLMITESVPAYPSYPAMS